MNRYRRLLILGLGLALTVGMSCTSGDMPLESQIGGAVPADTAGAVPPDTNGAVPPDTAGAVPPDTTGAVPPDTAGTVPTDTSGAAPSDTSGTVPSDTVGTVPSDTGSGQLGLLTCEPQRYAIATQVIGPKGGQINVGDHDLKIFENALSEDVTITMEQVEGPVNSVRLSPEGLHFAIPVVLTLSYRNCENVWLPKRLVDTDESLTVIEPLLSLDFSSLKKVKGLIYHFSRYAVAF